MLHGVIAFGVLMAFAFTGGLACAAQGDTNGAEFATIAVLNSLDAPGIQPFHMVVSYTRYDTAQSIEGKLELWSLGKNQTRVELTEPGRKGTYLLTAAGRLRSKDSPGMSQALVLLLRDLEHPFPASLQTVSQGTEDGTFGSVNTRCYYVVPSSISQVPAASIGKVPTFCVDQAHVLRVAWFQSGVKLVNEDSRTFQDHPVPGAITIYFGEHQMLKAHVDQLESWSEAVDLAADSFVPDAFTGPIRISGGVMQGLLANSVPPQYPVTAKQDHVSGTVVLAASIGKDGRVSNVRVISSPRQDLTDAAVNAVQQWTYEPYQLNGVVTQVSTTITVNFNLSPGR